MQVLLNRRLTLALVGMSLLMGGSVAPAQDFERFVTVGEGYTAGPSEGMHVESRNFTTSNIPTLCASPDARRADRLVAKQQQIQLSTSEPFSFGDANVTAVDTAGLPLGPVPILLEVNEGSDPILNLETYKVTGKHIRAIRPGAFRVRIHTLCGGDEGGRSEEPEIILQYIVKAE